jgi:hypothetical protein
VGAQGLEKHDVTRDRMRHCRRYCQQHERRQSDDERRFLAAPASIDFERATRRTQPTSGQSLTCKLCAESIAEARNNECFVQVNEK